MGKQKWGARARQGQGEKHKSEEGEGGGDGNYRGNVGTKLALKKFGMQRNYDTRGGQKVGLGRKGTRGVIGSTTGGDVGFARHLVQEFWSGGKKATVWRCRTRTFS